MPKSSSRLLSSIPDINLFSIRPVQGKSDKGFEELCVQLLPLMIDEHISRLDRVEGCGGDEGIEAVAVTTSNQHIGIQAKYFDKLGSSQWIQISKSVQTAIQKHPELSRYIVCVPLDRTPAAIKKWDALKATWSLSLPSLSVEWCGAFELRKYLIQPSASHYLTYWFGCPEFSLEWVSRQTELAIEQLHHRYTPELHQATLTEQGLGFILALQSARRKHRNRCSDLIIAWRTALEKLSNVAKVRDASHKDAAIEPLRLAVAAINNAIADGDILRQGQDFILAVNGLPDMQVRSLLKLSQAFADELSNSELEAETKLAEAENLSRELCDSVTRFTAAQDQPLWLLDGEAGSGKSHLLASVARALLAEGRICLLLIGERFTSPDSPHIQATRLLGWEYSFRDLCMSASAHASLTGKASVIIIDAINETPQRGLWRKELINFAAAVQEYPNVKLLISCRSDCIASTVPEGILAKAVRVTHKGFDLKFHEAVNAYFEGYSVTTPQYPTLHAEFKNPLFLKTLCEAYQGRMLPLGSISFVGVLAAWEDRIAENIEDRIDCPRQTTKLTVNDLVREIADSDGYAITRSKAEEICQKRFQNQTATGSLYRQLCSSGLLQEIERLDATSVRLQYERFSDVRVAQTLLQRFSTKQEWLEYWRGTAIPKITENGHLNWRSGPRLFAYALLLPDRFGIELVECPIAFSLTKGSSRTHAKRQLWDVWLDAISWRSVDAQHEKIEHLFSLWTQSAQDDRVILERLIQFSCVPAHPLNADFLHRKLIAWELPRREVIWTIPLAHENPSDETNEGIIAPFLYWAEAAAGRMSDEQARLASIVLLWLTSSPNRLLRDRATDVAIKILSAGRSHSTCEWLLDKFLDVNDPYVKERLLAVIAGVIPYLSNNEDVARLAEIVLDRFWLQERIPPHILQREYASFIVNHACEVGALTEEKMTLLRRDAILPKPILWTEEQVAVYESDSRYSQITQSLRPEEMGMYGDFGRYVMGSAVHHFVDNEAIEPSPRGIGRGVPEHDARYARRYIWQRIIELGWSPSSYAEFEGNLGYGGRMNRGKVERISKKYQWIGLHEYLGLISDALPVREWDGSAHRLRGAWELSIRDYDPTAPLFVKRESDVEDDEDVRAPHWAMLPSPLGIAKSIADRRDWVQSEYSSFLPYLTVQHDERRWLVLHTHLDFNEDPAFGMEKYKTSLMGQWIEVRVFVIPKRQLAKSLRLLKGKDFFGDGCSLPNAYKCWITEYPWHPMLEEVDESCRFNDTWIRSTRQSLFLPVCEISEDEKHIILPAPTLYRKLSELECAPLTAIQAAADGSLEIRNKYGRSVIKGSTQGASLLMVDETMMQEYLKAEESVLVWAVLSEKSAWDGSHHVGGISTQSAVFVLQADGRITGGMTTMRKEPPEST